MTQSTINKLATYATYHHKETIKINHITYCDETKHMAFQLTDSQSLWNR